MRLPVRFVIVCFAMSGRLAAQSTAGVLDGSHDRPITRSQAVRAAGAIRIDGRLDEVAWRDAPVTDAFTQVEPDEAKPATQRTEVRVVYDDAAIYVGVRLHDSGPIIGRLGRRDMPLGDSDWFGLMIDSWHDHRTAFGFDVNPAGVRRDEIKTIDVDDNSWDAVWEVATTVDSAGWTAEYRIPFSQLRFSSADEQTWGVQFERMIGRRAEYSVSTYIPRAERGGVPRYGHLLGLRAIRPGKRLEVLPYTVQRASYERPGPNPFRTDHEMSTSGGLDLLYRPTSNLTLNAAFNPDFGQVEVDPAVVNLGVYETFFAEKRPFFIEGSEIFAFGVDGTSGGQLFYSRRIGRAPSLTPPSLASDAPAVTTILGASKVSGKVAGWSFGMLEAVAAKENSRFRADDGSTQHFAVEPLSNYLVARARREARGGQTIVGGILTAVDRRLDTEPFRDAMRSSALAGGIDFRHEWGKRTWVVHGDAEVSRVAGSASAITATQRQSNHFFQRPDADHLTLDSTATSLSGYSANMALGKQSGEHWRGELATAITSPGYEVNDLGFAVRTDRHDFQSTITYVQNHPGRLLRRWYATGVGRLERNFAWEPILRYASMTALAQTLGYWTATLTTQRFFQALDDRLTRGGPLALRPAWWYSSATVTTDGRKPVTLASIVSGQKFDYGGWTWGVGVTAGVKASSRWNLTVGPSVSRVYTPAQFVISVADPAYTPTFGRRYVFSPLRQTSIGLETRFNMTFTPRLSLETYAQPLLSSADFGDAKQLVAPRTYDFAPYAGSIPNLDFNLRSLRGNAVLRWEWRQGSTLYVAWQQRRLDRVDNGDFDFSRDRSALFRAHPDNILLVKVNYWLNP